ncbi:hypothetical protein POTOM_032673 [Populus tomentosa]|uniref:Uncharacterized protein n=1 Tax=Populus tomentosa TaxID=118781 RepID=A0A8X7Z737_POPTO|nr:hypothetical protein POTOM_032673 [Populus tomentosa]
MTVTSGLARTASQKQRSPTSMQIERTPGFTTAHKHFNYYTDRTLSFVEQWAQLSSLNQLMSCLQDKRWMSKRKEVKESGDHVMAEKWKLSKKEGSSSFTRSFSTKSSSSKAPLLRSSSLKISSPKCPLPRSYSQKSPSISRKCSSLAKEQKARTCFALLLELSDSSLISSLFCFRFPLCFFLMGERFISAVGTGSPVRDSKLVSSHDLWRWIVVIVVSPLIFVPFISSVNSIEIAGLSRSELVVVPPFYM